MKYIKRNYFRINIQKIWFFEKINDIYKGLLMLTNEKKKNSKIFMVQNEMGGVNTYERDF